MAKMVVSMPAVLIPQAQRPIADLTSGWQSVFADAEALQLPPVKHGLVEVIHADGNIRDLFSVQNTQSDPSGRPGNWVCNNHKATCGTISNERFRISHNGSVRCRRDLAERVGRYIGHPSAIDIDGRINNCSIVGQNSYALFDLGQRQAREVDDFKLPGDLTDAPPRSVFEMSGARKDRRPAQSA